VTTGGVPAPRLFDGRYGSRRRTRDWNKQQQRLVGPQRTLKFQRRTNEAAGLARPYKHHVDRRRSSFELGRHAGIGPVELRTDRANDRDNGDGKCRRRSGLIQSPLRRIDHAKIEQEFDA
jgi:hypothetical protein